jgi:hypothetical protein
MKSHSIFYIELFRKMIQDCTIEGDEKSSLRDFRYLFGSNAGEVGGRLFHEGLPLLTEVLPSFGKAILGWIEAGRVHTPFPGFATDKGGLLPKLFSGWTKRIFHRDGSVRPEADPHALQELLQICMLLYKLELPASQGKKDRVIEQFVLTEHELSQSTQKVSFDSSIFALAKRLISEVLGKFDPYAIKPKHGPGAVSTGEKGNEKWDFRRKFQRLHGEYPYYEYFSPSLSHVGLLASGHSRRPLGSLTGYNRLNRFSESFTSWYRGLEPSVLPIAKVVLVPKDSRGPRLISMEPLEIQFIQQGIMRELVSHIESHPLTKGKVRFNNQTPNQDAALKSSRTRECATLDLKEASDRVSLALFQSLFPEHIVKAFEACRSVATELPDGTILPLKKFAPMGSALCFPVMALTIWALSEASLLESNLSTAEVLVYGDDLVIPTPGFSAVVNCLHDHGLLVNTGKSFKDSFFRESCGMDAFKGVQVTPVRLKKLFTGSVSSPTFLEHLIALSEAFFDKGYWRVTDFLRKEVSRVYGKVPWTHDRSYPGFFTPSPSIAWRRNSCFRKRYNANLQRWEVLVRVRSQPRTPSQVSVAGRMLKGLTGLFEFAGEDNRVTPRDEGVLRWRYRPA